jgi:uncharacterized protein (TIGR03905 family)
VGYNVFGYEYPAACRFHTLNQSYKRKEIIMIYKTSGVCSREITFEIDEATDTITALHFNGGCAGNTGGLVRLIVGMKVDDVITKLEGVRCDCKLTSCPDQLARALKEWRQGR